MNAKICVQRKAVFLLSLMTITILSFILYSTYSKSLLERNFTQNSRAANPKKPIQPKPVLPIINSQVAGANWFPYMARIILPNGGVCGGSLISENYVLTAAHCVYNESINGGIIKVLVGVNTYSGDYLGQYAGIVEHSSTNKNIYVHESYRPTTTLIEDYKDLVRNTHDIALLRLKVKATGVPTISFPRSESNPNNYPEKIYMGTKATVVGSGLLRPTDTDVSPNLMMAEIPIDDYLMRPSGTILLKAANAEAGEVVLSGDSGGAGILYYNNRPYIIGVIMSGQQAWLSSFLTSTSHYSNWIANTSQVQPESGSVTNSIGSTTTFPPQVPVCGKIHSKSDCLVFNTMCEWYRGEGEFCKTKN